MKVKSTFVSKLCARPPGAIAPSRPSPATKVLGGDHFAKLFGSPTSAVLSDARSGRPTAVAKALFGAELLNGVTGCGNAPPAFVAALTLVVLPDATVPVDCAATEKSGALPGVVAIAVARPDGPVAFAVAFAAPPPTGVKLRPRPEAPPVACAVAFAGPAMLAALASALASPPLPPAPKAELPPLPPFALAFAATGPMPFSVCAVALPVPPVPPTSLPSAAPPLPPVASALAEPVAPFICETALATPP